MGDSVNVRNKGYWFGLASLSACEFGFVTYLITGTWEQFAVGTVGVFVLNLILINVLGERFKNFLTFWKMEDALPGMRVFSQLLPQDDRVDSDALKLKMGGFPKEGRQQNIAWYKMYKGVKTDPSIKDQNFQFILMKDMVAHLFIYMVVGVLYFLVMHTLTIAGLFLFGTFPAYLILSYATQNRAEKMVLSVVALYASEP